MECWRTRAWTNSATLSCWRRGSLEVASNTCCNFPLAVWRLGLSGRTSRSGLADPVRVQALHAVRPNEVVRNDPQMVPVSRKLLCDPSRLCGVRSRPFAFVNEGEATTSLRLEASLIGAPRVARFTRNPWAGGRNPVGIEVGGTRGHPLEYWVKRQNVYVPHFLHILSSIVRTETRFEGWNPNLQIRLMISSRFT